MEWKTKKIKTIDVCKLYEEDRLRMLDVYSCLATMKLTWFRGSNVNDSSLKIFVLSMYPELCNLSKFGSEYVNRKLYKD